MKQQVLPKNTQSSAYINLNGQSFENSYYRGVQQGEQRVAPSSNRQSLNTIHIDEQLKKIIKAYSRSNMPQLTKQQFMELANDLFMTIDSSSSTALTRDQGEVILNMVDMDKNGLINLDQLYRIVKQNQIQ